MDSGYIRVRNQLWLWVDAVNKANQKVQVTPVQSQPQALDEQQVDPRIGHQVRSRQTEDGEGRSVSSGGGAIFMGDISAGRDFSYNQG